MIGYLNVDRSRIDDVLEGRMTFALRRVGGARHPQVGETLNVCCPIKKGQNVDVLLRGGSMHRPIELHQFATAHVVYRARVHLRPEGMARVLPGHAIGPAGERLSRQFLAAESGASLAAEHLAKLTLAQGFTTWDDLYAYLAAQQSANKPRPPLIREVIGWAKARKLKGAVGWRSSAN